MMASPWTAALLCPIPHPHHHALSPLTAPVPALCPGDPAPAHCRAISPLIARWPPCTLDSWIDLNSFWFW